MSTPTPSFQLTHEYHPTEKQPYVATLRIFNRPQTLQEWAALCGTIHAELAAGALDGALQRALLRQSPYTHYRQWCASLGIAPAPQIDYEDMMTRLTFVGRGPSCSGRQRFIEFVDPAKLEQISAARTLELRLGGKRADGTTSDARAHEVLCAQQRREAASEKAIPKTEGVCEECGKAFAGRKGKRFCGDNCRILSFKHKRKAELVSSSSVTE
jgi:predicted nucleic acid-binding Zn ribbon protein